MTFLSTFDIIFRWKMLFRKWNSELGIGSARFSMNMLKILDIIIQNIRIEFGLTFISILLAFYKIRKITVLKVIIYMLTMFSIINFWSCRDLWFIILFMNNI